MQVGPQLPARFSVNYLQTSMLRASMLSSDTQSRCLQAVYPQCGRKLRTLCLHVGYWHARGFGVVKENFPEMACWVCNCKTRASCRAAAHCLPARGQTAATKTLWTGSLLQDAAFTAEGRKTLIHKVFVAADCPPFERQWAAMAAAVQLSLILHSHQAMSLCLSSVISEKLLLL